MMYAIASPKDLPTAWNGKFMHGHASLSQEQAQKLADAMAGDVYYLEPTKTAFVLAEEKEVEHAAATR